MSNTGDSGFGQVTHVNGARPKADPGGKPSGKGAVQTTVLTTSVTFRDWVRADMEYKENSVRAKYS